MWVCDPYKCLSASMCVSSVWLRSLTINTDTDDTLMPLFELPAVGIAINLIDSLSSSRNRLHENWRINFMLLSSSPTPSLASLKEFDCWTRDRGPCQSTIFRSTFFFFVLSELWRETSERTTEVTLSHFFFIQWTSWAICTFVCSLEEVIKRTSLFVALPPL